MKLFITSAAELDLEEIEAHISSDNPAAADRFLQLLLSRLNLLAEMPGIGRRRNKYARGVRSIAEGNYIIVYRVKNDTVEVLRVLHGARDPERVFREKPIEK
ncbi:MAG: type II toxin-antitoxin system RelE/ParE family toxin [Candidatus Obscuribacterales bacterium]|nr:type II toxin-antitoxin system RelE/ParE family toxin [Candidatus Obscuribacterales bacterium]